MGDKIFLKKEQLEQVSGGTGTVYTANSHACPDCGSDKVTLIGEQYDAGYYMCNDCGCTFYGDI